METYDWKKRGPSMTMYSADPLFEDFAVMLGLGLGGQHGEITAACAGVADGDNTGWNAAWSALADRLVDEADRSVAEGHRTGARESYLRAGLYYAIGYHPLYGSPTNSALLTGFRRQTVAFTKAAALADPPGEPIEIPYEGITLPGWLFRSTEGPEPRPLLIATNGYD